MAARDTGCDRLLPVQHLRPGDHAFVSYGDDEVRWEVVTAFVRLGLARGEKVLVLPCPGVPADEVLARIDFPSRSTVPARERGQLVVSSMREVIRPDTEFTAARQMSRLRAETDRATAEGHTGLRAFIDMGWVRALGADVQVMAARETGAHALFSGRPYTEICAYDRRRFDRTLLTAMERAHPRVLLERLGSLRSTRGPDGTLHFIGEADATHRPAVGRALEISLAQTAPARRLTVDLTRLHFLSVGCAVGLLTLARGAAGHELIEVRCDRGQRRMLRRLGAGTVSRLVLTEVVRPW
ncbi:MEDS domain-containing protein [Streptomyces nigrescens]|uniref:MEDS domain-containing protein n=1 Tax=Streptomyces nigrescens TaxID=1920 RepID=A0ABY7JAJ5_STRNI|nr:MULTISPECIES: MEDS domain-containing protein [Streptomyces]MCX5450477.1 MEDS domain-containing protein [Streptomyces libani]WAU08228.1 MEDS domain-containing protein [Streptomyces nigrescens]